LPEILNGERILVLSGIANPERFEKSISEYASEVISYRLGDHAEYDAILLKKIAVRAIEEKCEFIAITTKDAVKMLDTYRAMQRQDASLPAIAVIHSDIEFIQGKELLFNKINNLFKTHS